MIEARYPFGLAMTAERAVAWAHAAQAIAETGQMAREIAANSRTSG
jgi:hypothetical protein